MKEIKDDLNIKRDTVSWVMSLNILKISISPQN